MRCGLFLLLLASFVCGAQELPDPGRRLSQEEQNADPDKPRPTDKAAAAKSDRTARNSQACERSRTYYQLACRAPNSPQSRSMECAEAYALYRQSCP